MPYFWQLMRIGMFWFGGLLFLVFLRLDSFEFLITALYGCHLSFMGCFFVQMLCNSLDNLIVTLQIGAFIILIQ